MTETRLFAFMNYILGGNQSYSSYTKMSEGAKLEFRNLKLKEIKDLLHSVDRSVDSIQNRLDIESNKNSDYYKFIEKIN